MRLKRRLGPYKQSLSNSTQTIIRQILMNFICISLNILMNWKEKQRLKYSRIKIASLRQFQT
jgi:hypothetical protein